jgi:hydrogenase maturation protease
MAVVRVIGCGNADAGDDAAGILAVAEARIALEAVPGVEVVPHASPLEIVHLLEGADAVVVVDAVRTSGGGRVPGTPVRAEAGPGGLPAEIRSSLSSHGLGVAEAVGLAAAIGSAPRIVVLGIEAEEAAPGAGLSRAVRRGVSVLAEMILHEATVLAEASAPASDAEAERSSEAGPTGPRRARPPGRP